MDPVARSKIPNGHEMVVPYTNHSELQHINDLAREAGATNLPFQDVETLVEDTGERFFSEYFHWQKENKPGNDPKIDCCLCIDCNPSAALPSLQDAPQQPAPQTPAAPTPTAAVANTPTPMATVAPPPVVPPPVVPPPRAAPIAPPAAAIPIAPMPPPAVPPPLYYPQYPQYHPQFYLMNQFMQPQTNWNPQDCCNRYRTYRMEGSRGRPPHDHNCWKKNGGSTNNII